MKKPTALRRLLVAPAVAMLACVAMPAHTSRFIRDSAAIVFGWTACPGVPAGSAAAVPERAENPGNLPPESAGAITFIRSWQATLSRAFAALGDKPE